MKFKYAIWCVVDGGVTGHRENYMKKNNNIAIYDTKEEAELECPECRCLTTGACLEYTVVQIPIGVK